LISHKAYANVNFDLGTIQDLLGNFGRRISRQAVMGCAHERF